MRTQLLFIQFSMDPTISVVMSVYNAAPFLRQAIQSILDQTYADFEFLIFNDGSTDGSLEVIKSFNDPRIRIYTSDINRGYTYHFNQGIGLAKGKYIARMDADDMSLPDRFEKQINFLEKNPDFGMIGAWVKIIDELGKSDSQVWEFTAPPEEIPVIMLFTNHFAHPTIMLRKSALPEILYRPEYVPTEDFELWTRIADRHKVGNLQEILLKYRKHGNNIGSRMNVKCREMVMVILGERLKAMDMTYTAEELLFHNSLSFDALEVDQSFLTKTNDWYARIYEANMRTKRYDKVILFKALLGRWYILCKKYKTNPWNKIRVFFSSKILRNNHFTPRDYVYFTKIMFKRFLR